MTDVKRWNIDDDGQDNLLGTAEGMGSKGRAALKEIF